MFFSGSGGTLGDGEDAPGGPTAPRLLASGDPVEMGFSWTPGGGRAAWPDDDNGDGDDGFDDDIDDFASNTVTVFFISSVCVPIPLGMT